MVDDDDYVVVVVDDDDDVSLKLISASCILLFVVQTTTTTMKRISHIQLAFFGGCDIYKTKYYKYLQIKYNQNSIFLTNMSLF